MKKYIIILVVFIGTVILISCRKNMEGMENESALQKKSEDRTSDQEYDKITDVKKKIVPSPKDDPWAVENDGSTESIFDDPAVTGVEVNDNGKWVEKKPKHPHHKPSHKGGEKIPKNLDYCPSDKYTWGNQKTDCKKIPTIPEGCGASDTQFCALVNNQNVNDNPDESGVTPPAYKSFDVKALCNTGGSCDTITETIGCGSDTDNIKPDSISNTITTCVKNWFTTKPAVGQKGARNPIHLVDGTIISPYGSNSTK
tara:strand:+ start:9 stop:773 length:765 start_codon:yes stop_codon:yes gene_type:complete